MVLIIQSISKNFLKNNTRVDVLSKNNVRLVVNSDKNKTFFAAKRPHLLALNALKVGIALNFAVKIFFSPHSPEFVQKKETAVPGFEPLPHACHHLRNPLRHLSLTSMIFPVNIR